MATKTIGVIGLGSIGMRHAKNLLAMGHTVYGQDTEVAKIGQLIEAGGHNMDGSRPYSGYDAIVIATPSDTHNRLRKFWLEAGEHVFVEKPIATSKPDRFAHPDGLVQMVGYNLRFHSCVKKAKEWLDAGLIGEPLWANFCCAQENRKYKDPVVLNWSHEIDLACYLLGPAKVLAATGDDSIIDVNLKHDNGCRTTAHLDYLTAPEERSFIICGTRANMQFELTLRGGMIEFPDGQITRYRGTDSYDENYAEEMQAFLDRIDGKPAIGCTGEEGLRVLEVCLEARSKAGIAPI